MSFDKETCYLFNHFNFKDLIRHLDNKTYFEKMGWVFHSSISEISTLMQFPAPQFSHNSVQNKPFFLQIHWLVSQYKVHPHLIIFIKESGAGALSIVIG